MRKERFRQGCFALTFLLLVGGCKGKSLDIPAGICEEVRVTEVSDICSEKVDLSSNPCLDLCLVLNRLESPITQGEVGFECTEKVGGECDPDLCPYCGDEDCLRSELQQCEKMPTDAMRSDCVCCIAYRSKYIDDASAQECQQQLCALSPDHPSCRP
ncbi:MAG: hypothetical protein D6812_02950 [Deltaproteobacteria bacterium]|nr:MAG: hypothetical protein D6812_02950 [Deltaproteobacteria bacterium]